MHTYHAIGVVGWAGKRNHYCKTMSRSKNNKRKKLYRSDEKGNKAKVHTNIILYALLTYSFLQTES